VADVGYPSRDRDNDRLDKETTCLR
jgi:hypothetical protein